MEPDAAGTLGKRATNSSSSRAYEMIIPSAPPFTAIVDSVAFSADGKTLASTGDRGMVRLWDVATRGPAGRPLPGHTGRVTEVAFSPDGKTLASGAQTGPCGSGTSAAGARSASR